MTKAIIALCGLLVVCGLAACIAGAKAAKKAEPVAVIEPWSVTDHGETVQPVQPVAVLPDRAKVMKMAAEMAKAKLKAATNCGDPKCDCGCQEGGECKCVVVQKPVQQRPVEAPLPYTPIRWQYVAPNPHYQQQPMMQMRRGGGC